MHRYDSKPLAPQHRFELQAAQKRWEESRPPVEVEIRSTDPLTLSIHGLSLSGGPEKRAKLLRRAGMMDVIEPSVLGRVGNARKRLFSFTVKKFHNRSNEA